VADALCLKCGEPKGLPWKRCRSCNFDPTGDEESLVRSVYLSVARFNEAAASGSYRKQLDAMGAALRAGQSIDFDPGELARLRRERAALESVPISAVWLTIVRFFLPAVLFIGGLLGLSYLLRALRS
jgi:hypothetical protein